METTDISIEEIERSYKVDNYYDGLIKEKGFINQH